MIASIYKKSNGQIIKSVSCSEEDLPLQYDVNNFSYIEGSFDDSMYYIENNEPVAISSAPNQYCVYNYDTKEWVDPRTNETQWVIVRNQRDTLLAASDWTQLLDVYLPNKSIWAVYRQNLRDVTNQSDPFNIIWPTQPQG